jgi:DNA-binding MarR family transcriptional regulator
VLAALLGDPKIGLSVADLARQTRFTKPNVSFAVDALVLAGLLEARAVGNERRVTLTGKGKILPDLAPPVRQPDWVTRFGIGLDVLRFTSRDGMSPSVRAVEARAVIESMKDRITNERVPQPNFDALGEEFGFAFDRWVVQLVDWLRSPSRA